MAPLDRSVLGVALVSATLVGCPGTTASDTGTEGSTGTSGGSTTSVPTSSTTGSTSSSEETTTTAETTRGAETTGAETGRTTGTGESTGVSGRCGDGELTADEACDDGNAIDEDGCTDCVFDAGWVCDKEPTVCTPVCGDGLVVADEGCDDGDLDPYDGCDAACTPEPYYGCTGEPSTCVTDCGSEQTFGGIAVDGEGNMATDHVWDFGGEVGLDAGDAMCQAIGADHVCSYGEVELARSKGELDGLFGALPVNKAFWVHRVAAVLDDGLTLAAGSGGRCNDWANGENHTADSELGVAQADGTIDYTFDTNACYTGNQADSCAGGGGNCGGQAASILCCFPVCPEEPNDGPWVRDNNGCDGEVAVDMTGQADITLTGPFPQPTCLRVSTGTTFTHLNTVGQMLIGGDYHDDRDTKHYLANVHGSGGPGSSPIAPDCANWSGNICTSTWTLDAPGAYPFVVDGDAGNQRGAIYVE